MTTTSSNLQEMPVKATPYDHQKKAFTFALRVFGALQSESEVMPMTPINKGGKGCALLMEMQPGNRKNPCVDCCRGQYVRIG